MALLLLKKSPHALWRICANAADLADCNYIADDYETQEISEEDFQALRVKSKYYNNDSQAIVTREAGVHAHASVSTTSAGLKMYLNDIVSTLDNYAVSNQGKQLATQTETYSELLRDYTDGSVDLESLDYSGEGGINWEKYCADNSITFLSPLQIG